MSPLIAVNGKIIVAFMKATNREFDPLTGSLGKTCETGAKHRHQPIAAKGNYYAHCINGELVVVKTGNALVDGEYCWGANAARSNCTLK